MTTTGKVFCVLNVLAAIFYAYLTAPVAQYRTKMHKQIEDGIEQIAKLKKEAEELDVERVKLLREISDEEVATAVLKGTIAERKQQADRVNAELDDLLKFTRQLLANWSETVTKITDEIDNRTKEIAELETDLDKTNDMFKIRSGEVADLETRLNDATAALAKYLGAMAENLKKLLAAEEQQEKKSANLAGGRTNGALERDGR